MEYFFHFGLFLFFFCAYFRGIFVSDQRRDGVVLKRVSQLLAMKKILWLTLPMLLVCSGMTGLMAQTNVSGTIMSNTFWTVANGPYIVTGDLLVDQAATLNLEPGLTVRFEPNTLLTVEGRLEAPGTILDSIFFISNQLAPGLSAWEGIQVSGSVGGFANLDYCQIRNASKAVSIFGNPIGSQIVLRNTLFKNNAQAVADLSGNQIVYRCSFQGNAEGVVNSSLSLQRCSFDGNSFGIQNFAGSIDSCTFSAHTTAAINMSSGSVAHTLFLYNQVAIGNHQLAGTDSILRCQFAQNDTAVVIGTNMPTFIENELCENLVNFKVATSSNVNIGRNCWCSTDSTAILASFVDGRNNQGLGVLNIAPINAECGVIGQVWPGDTDDDGVARVSDLLYIGVAMGGTGEPRFSPNAGWIGQAGLPWDQNFGFGLNYKHADCDGDGVVTFADANVIVSNYGQTHQKMSSHVNTGGIPLYIEMPRRASAGDTITLNLRLGDLAHPANDVYGVAFGLGLNSSLFDLASAQTTTSGSWLGVPGQNLIDLTIKDSKLNWAIVRDDHQDTTGFGRLGGVTMVMIDDLNEVLPPDEALEPFDVSLIDYKGNTIPIDVFIVAVEPCTPFGLSICPNPANERMVVMLDSLDGEEVAVYDANGRQMFIQSGTLQGNIVVPTASYTPGIYYVHVRVKQGILTKKVIILK